QQHCAETSRVVVTEQALAEVDIDMIVAHRRWRGRLENAQVARHPEVHDQSGLSEIEQQILAAPLHASQAAALQRSIESVGHRPAQAALANLDPPHDAMREAGLQAATNDF